MKYDGAAKSVMPYVTKCHQKGEKASEIWLRLGRMSEEGLANCGANVPFWKRIAKSYGDLEGIWIPSADVLRYALKRNGLLGQPAKHDSRWLSWYGKETLEGL